MSQFSEEYELDENTADTEQSLRQEFEQMLNSEERQRFSHEYLRESGRTGDFETIDVNQARLWITRRVFGMGWSQTLFPDDHGGRHGDYSRYENVQERIGKKYQRIALDELGARLADNFWMKSDYCEDPIIYKYPHEHFRRDMDPTLLPESIEQDTTVQSEDGWLFGPDIRVIDSEIDAESWPFEINYADGFIDQLTRQDENGESWIVLAEHNYDRTNYEDDEKRSFNYKNEEFRFVYCALAWKIHPIKELRAQNVLETL